MIKFKTDGSWGAGLGRKLHAAEIDENFYELVQRINGVIDSPGFGLGIATFEVVGNLLYVHMTDSTVEGPFTLPTANWTFIGNWQANTVIPAYSVFTNNGDTYLALITHISDPTSFDPDANDGSGNDLYALIVSPEKGNPGQRGAQGFDGPIGEPGMFMPGRRGITGDRGITWKGEYNPLIVPGYVINDAISYQGSAWICINPTVLDPISSSADWQLLASRGNDGDPMGPAGKDGIPGFPGLDGSDGFMGVPGKRGEKGTKGDKGDMGDGGSGGGGGGSGFFGSGGDTGAAPPWVDPISVPMLTDFAWVHQGAATSPTDAAGFGIVVTAEGSGDQIHALMKTVPSGNWTADIGIIPPIPQENFIRGGLAIYDSVGGKLFTVGISFISGVIGIDADGWNSTTSHAATPKHIDAVGAANMYFFRVHWDGTHNNFYYSYDGINYTLLYQEASGSFFDNQPNKVGLFISSNVDTAGALECAIRCFHYKDDDVYNPASARVGAKGDKGEAGDQGEIGPQGSSFIGIGAMAECAFNAKYSGTFAVTSASTALLPVATENFDVGSFYNNTTTNYKWTPPSGVVQINGMARGLSNGASQSFTGALILLKNGSEVIRAGLTFAGSGSPNEPAATIAYVDEANGTDYYQLAVAGVASFTGNVIAVDFSGVCGVFADGLPAIDSGVEDGDVLTVESGVAVWAAPGGGGGGGGGYWGPVTKPVLSDFTAQNSAANDGGNALGFAVVNSSMGSSGNIQPMMKAVPGGGSWYVDMGCSAPMPMEQYVGGGICLRESSSGKIITFNFNYQADSQIQVNYWTNYTSYSSGQKNWNNPMPHGFFRIHYTGSAYEFWFSTDNIVWGLVVSKAQTDFFASGADQVGLFFNPQENSGGPHPGGVNFFHYLEH